MNKEKKCGNCHNFHNGQTCCPELPQGFCKQSCTVKNCKGKVIGRCSPDIDLRSIGFCKKHKTIVAGAYVGLMNGNRFLLEKVSGIRLWK